MQSLMDNFVATKHKKSQFLRVLLIMLFYENVIVMLMSLEVGKNSGTAILLISAVLHAFIGFFIDFLLPSIMIYELIRNTILLAEYPTSTLEI